MSAAAPIKPTHKAIHAYYDALKAYAGQHVEHEGALEIEGAAATLTEFSEKQHFLNTVYEWFFQGYSVKAADTHGIVYTPQEIVDFMCAGVGV